MKTIDLHVHSNFSDGTCTPEELVDLAVKSGLSAFALTDHDTIDGVSYAISYAETLKNKGMDITVIPGVELSAGYKKRDIHILGLYLNCQDQKLNSTLSALKKEREQRNQKMIQNFQNAGFDITMENLMEESKDAVITRAHFAKQLVKKNYVSSSKEAFQKYLGEDGPFYVARKFITPEGAIDLIKEAGGIPILAHPILYHLPASELDSLVKRLTDHGLKGIETIYSTYSIEEQNIVSRLAAKYNLVRTGGSDFHGRNKPDIRLGTGMGNLSIPYSILNELKAFF